MHCTRLQACMHLCMRQISATAAPTGNVEHGRAGENLRRMSRARHGLYMVIVGTLVAHGVCYTLPRYQGMPSWQGTAPSRVMLGPEGVSGPSPGEADALRPPGEGQSFMPLFAQAAALKL